MFYRLTLVILLAAGDATAHALPVVFWQNGRDYVTRLGPAEARFRSAGIDLAGGHLEFAGADPKVAPRGENRLPAQINVLNGSSPSQWKHFAVFDSIRYPDLYPGIDLRYSVTDGHMKSEFRIQAGADPAKVRMRLTGFEKTVIRQDGSLSLRSAQGEYLEDAPLVCQDRGAERTVISARYVFLDRDTIGFAIGEFDRAQPLIIDPSITFSTYLGGSAFDSATAVATDASGNVYVAGWTESTDFTSAGMQPRNAGSTDAFVAKFNPAGQLVFATYLGGSGSDQATGIAVDGSGSVWVTGWTKSLNFPLVIPYQNKLKGGRNAFIAALMPDGSALRFSTYLGGTGDDQANAIAVDSGGSVYVVGQTTSRDLPLLRPIQSRNAGGQDAFALKLTNSGNLSYCTYVGGSADDVATGVAVDASGAVVLVGSTWSPDFPVATPAQPAIAGGEDAFVTKLNPAGTAFIYSTFLGGVGGTVGFPEYASAVAIDASGNAYVGGTTSSPGFATPFAFQAVPQGALDGFVAKYSPSGTIQFRTYLGGTSFDYVTAIAVTAAGVAAAGYTVSSDFPVVNAVQPQHRPDWDAFLCELNSNGSAMVFGTFLGGSGADAAYGAAVVPQGYVLVGSTQSYDFPLVSAAKTVNGANFSAFVTQICVNACSAAPSVVSVAPATGGGNSQVFQATFSDPDGWTYIQSAELDLVAAGGATTCGLYYNASAGQIGLWNDSGTASAGSVVPGVVTSAENSSCILYGAGSSFTGSGNLLTLQLSVAFKSGFAGPKNLKLTAQNRSNLSSGTLIAGNWNVIAPVSLWPSSIASHTDITVDYAEVTGDHRADVIVTNAGNQFLVAPSPTYRPLSIWVQHGPSLPGQMQFADVNGDGRADAIYFDTLRSNGLWVALSTGSGFTSPAQWVSLSSFGASTPDQVQYADVNGDGRADAIYFDAGRTNTVWVCLSTGTGFGPPQRWLQHGASIPSQLQFADVNGDGRADAIYFDTFRSDGIWVSLSTGTGFSSPSMWLQHGASTPDQIHYVDVDGDGRADCVYFDVSRSRGVWVSRSTGTGFTTPEMWLQHGQSTPSQLQFADVNGDGRADALYFDTYRTNGVWVGLSTGTGFTTPTKWLQFVPSTPDQIQYRDINGDGLADAIYADLAGTKGIWVSYSNGPSFSIPVLLMDLH